MVEETSVQEGALSAMAVRQEFVEEFDQHLVWRKNAPLLYDLFATCDLGHAAQSVSWLTDVENELTKVAVGTRAADGEKGTLSVLELTCVVDTTDTDDLEHPDPWKSWTIPELGSMRGFGLKGMKDQAPLRKMVDFTLTSDPNRICACAREASVFAVKGSCGSVMIFDYKTPGGPRSTLSEETPADGYALEWNPLEENVLGTGGHDGQLSIWDVKATSKIWSTRAHKEPLNDLCYSADGKQLVTVGEDHSTLLWDLRSKKKTMSFQASTEQLSVDWNHHETHQLLTGGKDGLVHVWDMRKVDDPLKSLRGHEQEVVQVKWCPASGEVTDFSPQNFLASACVGGQTILWNLAADSEDAGDGEAPEVLFIHNGHHAAMNDFGWSLLDDFLFCSVALDGFLQFWQPAAIITQDEMPNETGESAAKRLRIDS